MHPKRLTTDLKPLPYRWLRPWLPVPTVRLTLGREVWGSKLGSDSWQVCAMFPWMGMGCGSMRLQVF